jgi:hypothetical protein
MYQFGTYHSKLIAPFHIAIAGFPCEQEKASDEEEYTTQELSPAK